MLHRPETFGRKHSLAAYSHQNNVLILGTDTLSGRVPRVTVKRSDKDRDKGSISMLCCIMLYRLITYDIEDLRRSQCMGTADRSTLILMSPPQSHCLLCQYDIVVQCYRIIAFSCASGCVVECQICNREVAGSNLSLGYFAPRSTQPSIHPGSVNEYQL